MKLTVVEGGARSVLRFEREEVRIGRSLDNDIRLGGKLVSRNHARLERDGDGVWLVDLGSANGTLLDGERVGRARLERGAEIRIGEARIHFEEPDEPAPGDTQRSEPELATVGQLATVGLVTHTGENADSRENLRVFARVTRALVQEIELVPLLRLIVDAAVQLAGAERGFLMLAEEGAGGEPAELRARVARSFDGTDIPMPSARLSRGIAGEVLRAGRPLLSVDAGRDERFDGMASVEDLRLRSVLCLPIEIEGKAEGVLYLDNRLQQAVFTEDDLDTVELFAGQAALAIRNARLVAALRLRNQKLLESRAQIEGLNEQLGRKVRDRDQELAVVRAELERERGRYDYGDIVGASDGMRRVFQQLDRIIESELPVLIHGESGTGKELIARAIHFNGQRKERAFITENCAALPDSLLESELFGHTKGAFTGADRAKKGLIEQADGGTLFLDEIGDMTAEMQKKLLRVLQEGEVRPVGSSRTVKVDVRLLAASHRDLEAMVANRDFREDLYYRINVLGVQLPPLRERGEDIPLLAEALLARAAREAGRHAPVLTKEALAALVSYPWPGNVRELENEMRRLVVMAEEAVTPELLSSAVQSGTSRAGQRGIQGQAPAVDGDLRAAVAAYEQRAIKAALEEHGGNKSRAAAALGISRFALQRKLDKYGLGSSEESADEDGPEAETTPLDD